MVRTLIPFVFMTCTALCAAQQVAALAAGAGADPFMGEYAGIFSPAAGEPGHAQAKVIAEGGGRYRAVVARAGDPAWEAQLAGGVENGVLALAGSAAGANWKGRIERGVLVAAAAGEESASLTLLRIQRRSPSEGLMPPAGAVVLLPYQQGTPTTIGSWKNQDWKILPDGSVQVAHGHNETVAAHGSGFFHIEFRIPYEPEGRGQGRGNSGVYFASRYEIQVLDSFGLTLSPGDCGCIYGVAVAKENACLPPLAWQTYDVIFRAGRARSDGGFEPAQMTVFHNGVKIHENQPVPGPTTAAPVGENAERGPLYLQDHGHPVCFRNIWYLPLPD